MKINPRITRFWIEKISALMVDEERIRNVLEKVPDELITEPAKTLQWQC